MSYIAAYTRISQDRDGEAVGVSRQYEEIAAYAKAQGWSIDAHYSDTNRSAMTGRRPEYQRLLGDLGHVSTLLVWSADRLYRRLRELEHLVDVLGSTRVIALRSGDIDLSTADGRAVARILGALSQRESEKIGERVELAARERAMTGRPHGGPRAFGWETSGAQRDDELAAVQWAVKHLDAGGTLGQVAREWQARGFGAVTNVKVKRAIRNPRLIGMRRYRGKAVEGFAEPVVDVATWQRVNARFAVTGRGAPATTLLSGLLFCGKCGGKVLGHTRSRDGQLEPAYRCHANRCVSRKRATVDDRIDVAVADRLAANADLIIASIRPAAEVDALGPLKAELQALADMFAAGEIGAAVYGAAAEKTQARIAAAEALPQGSAGAAVQAMLASGDVRAAWCLATVGVQRQVLRVVIEKIIIEPGRGGSETIIWR